MKLRSRRHAFTLLEIMLVVAIISMLLTAAFYSLGDSFTMATTVRVEADLKSFDQKLKSYEMMNGFLPTTEQGLQALVTMPQGDPKPTRWFRAMDKLTQDPWHSDYVYVCPGTHNPSGYDLYSVGKDRKPGTADDVGNWEPAK